MENNYRKGNMPDFVGNLEVVAWQNTDENGETYLSVRFGKGVDLRKNEFKPNE